MKLLTYLEMVEAGWNEDQIYSALRERFDGAINQLRGIVHDAYKAGDAVALWEAGQHIKQLESQKDSMRKPNSGFLK